MGRALEGAALLGAGLGAALLGAASVGSAVAEAAAVEGSRLEVAVDGVASAVEDMPAATGEGVPSCGVQAVNAASPAPAVRNPAKARRLGIGVFSLRN